MPELVIRGYDIDKQLKRIFLYFLNLSIIVEQKIIRFTYFLLWPPPCPPTKNEELNN